MSKHRFFRREKTIPPAYSANKTTAPEARRYSLPATHTKQASHNKYPRTPLNIDPIQNESQAHAATTASTSGTRIAELSRPGLYPTRPRARVSTPPQPRDSNNLAAATLAPVQRASILRIKRIPKSALPCRAAFKAPRPL